MEEYSRIIIERYWTQHPNSQKAKRLMRLVTMSYDPGASGNDADAIYLEGVIRREKDPELKEALKDLDDYLFGW